MTDIGKRSRTACSKPPLYLERGPNRKPSCGYPRILTTLAEGQSLATIRPHVYQEAGIEYPLSGA